MRDVSSLTGEWKLQCGEKVGTITGMTLMWLDGQQETVLSRQGEDILMELDGMQYIGNVSLVENEIHWCDGEVWQKEQMSPSPLDTSETSLSPPPYPSPPKSSSVDLPEQEPVLDKRLTAPSEIYPLPDLEGDWFMSTDDFVGTISKDTLTWEDGRETGLLFQSDTLAMALEGEWHKAHIVWKEGEPTLIWSDGDLWKRGFNKSTDRQHVIGSGLVLPRCTNPSSPQQSLRCLNSDSYETLVSIGNQSLFTIVSQDHRTIFSRGASKDTTSSAKCPIDVLEESDAETSDAPKACQLADLEGEWCLGDGEYLGRISYGALLWGDSSITKLSLEGNALLMDLDGELHSATVCLKEEQLQWSNGVMWKRRPKNGASQHETVPDRLKSEQADLVSETAWLEERTAGHPDRGATGKQRSINSVTFRSWASHPDEESRTGSKRLPWEPKAQAVAEHSGDSVYISTNPATIEVIEEPSEDELLLEIELTRIMVEELQKREAEWNLEKNALELEAHELRSQASQQSQSSFASQRI